jgi:hypothetical protein
LRRAAARLSRRRRQDDRHRGDGRVQRSHAKRPGRDDTGLPGRVGQYAVREDREEALSD